MIIKKLTEKYSPNISALDLLPTTEDFTFLIESKLGYEKDYGTPEGETWQKKNFLKTPWGISWNLSPKGKKPDEKKALRYLIVSILIEWDDLIAQLKRTIGKSYQWEKKDIETAVYTIWKPHATKIAETMAEAINNLNNNVKESLDTLEEDIERHEELNPKLFDGNKLKEEVREKILEIVDEFVEDLTSDEVELDIEDIILIGSNVSYNYTKDSDLDIHIVANTKSLKCPENIINALYSAYRSLFNRKFDIDFYGIPVEIYVETEDSARVSNGVYSAKDNKWIKEPELTDIPELDQEAFDVLYKEWEDKCEELINEIKADNLEDETDIITMIEEIYELRKSGISEGEYSIQNLVFKELRNNKYLDDLKEYKDKLIAKRLSL